MCHCVFWYIMSVHRAAALCLAKALLKCPVPKSFTFPSRWECAGLTDGYTSSNLKEKIIAWLLMMDQSDEVEESCRPHPIICRLALCFLSEFDGNSFCYHSPESQRYNRITSATTLLCFNMIALLFLVSIWSQDLELNYIFHIFWHQHWPPGGVLFIYIKIQEQQERKLSCISIAMSPVYTKWNESWSEDTNIFLLTPWYVPS